MLLGTSICPTKNRKVNVPVLRKYESTFDDPYSLEAMMSLSVIVFSVEHLTIRPYSNLTSYRKNESMHISTLQYYIVPPLKKAITCGIGNTERGKSDKTEYLCLLGVKELYYMKHWPIYNLRTESGLHLKHKVNVLPKK